MYKNGFLSDKSLIGKKDLICIFNGSWKIVYFHFSDEQMEEPIEVLDEENENDRAPPINIDEGMEIMIIINIKKVQLEY